jgi:hypothetical protein
MSRKKSVGDKVARAAAAAASAAVKASQQDDTNKVLFNWGDEDDDDEQVADELLEGLEQIDETGDGSIVWELYCDVPLEKAGQIRKMATSELKGLRDECLSLGPGEYHIIARQYPRGFFVKNSRRKIKISGYARPAPNSPPAAVIDPQVLFQQYEERQERRRAQAIAERNAQIKFWAPILAPIGLEMAKGLFGRSGGESIKDLVAAMVGMKDLTGGGKSNDVENLLKGIELARDLNPADSKGATWPDVLVNGVTSIAKEFRPLAERLADRKNGAPAPAPAQLQFQTQPAGAGAPPGTPPPTAVAAPAGDGDPMLAMIEPLLRKLAGELEDFAVCNANADLTAEALLAKIPPLLRAQVQPAQLKEWLSQANWWPLLVGFHRTLEPYQAYCDDVRRSLLEIVEDMINPPPAEGEEQDAVS